MLRRSLGMALAVAGLTLFVSPQVAFAADRCGDIADKALFRSKTWSDLRRWFEQFPDCDDGYISEGVSEYVTRFLAKRWSELPTLVREIKRNAQFERFVLDHIDATAAYDNLKAIVDSATKRCPSDTKSLCESIADSAREAVAEVEHNLGSAEPG